MAWFRKEKKPKEAVEKQVAIPEGLWTKCEECEEILYRAHPSRIGLVPPLAFVLDPPSECRWVFFHRKDARAPRLAK